MTLLPHRARSFICTCQHRKRQHLHTKTQPNGPCADCSCTAFDPEPSCKCGHGKKAHTKHPKGYCHESYICGCTSFRPKGL